MAPIRTILRLAALGLLAGLVLGAAVALLHARLEGVEPGAARRFFAAYYLILGETFGLLAGWCAGLRAALAGLLEPLLSRIAEAVPSDSPLPGEAWRARLETLFTRAEERTPGFPRRILRFLFLRRIGRLGDLREAVARAEGRRPPEAAAGPWRTRAALEFLLVPVWNLFRAAYAVLLAVFLFGASVPFLR